MTIHGLPGLGADRRMYPEVWSKLDGFVPHDWPKHSGEETLSQVAETVCRVYQIKDGDVVVGSSLGGMVACEISKIRKLDTLILIGSAVTPAEISPLLSLLHPLANAAPIDWLRFSAGKIPTELSQMFANIETSFVRSMCAAIFKWGGLGDSATPLLRIHGKNDLVILPPNQPDLLINGGHLISITHPVECRDFIHDRVWNRRPKRG